MAKDDSDLGFGHFSTDETEHDWLTRSYDGCESTAAPDGKIGPMTEEELHEILRKVKIR
jgi:hypothetical protein